MEKPQIAVRIPPSLLDKLNSYIEKTGTTKTDVVIRSVGIVAWFVAGLGAGILFSGAKT